MEPEQFLSEAKLKVREDFHHLQTGACEFLLTK